MATSRSLVGDSLDIQRAVELIKLGARLPVLEAETHLSYEKLLKLYKEVEGKSPSRGMLPFSTEWFVSWQPNVHSSLFVNIYEYITKSSDIESIDAIIKAYRLYLETVDGKNLERVLSITRAWRLIRFIDAGMMTLTRCHECRGHYVVHTHELTAGYVCGLCRPPSRAGKSLRRKAEAHDAPREHQEDSTHDHHHLSPNC